jgi:hypothetical protein
MEIITPGLVIGSLLRISSGTSIPVYIPALASTGTLTLRSSGEEDGPPILEERFRLTGCSHPGGTLLFSSLEPTLKFSAYGRRENPCAMKPVLAVSPTATLNSATEGSKVTLAAWTLNVRPIKTDDNKTINIFFIGSLLFMKAFR